MSEDKAGLRRALLAARTQRDDDQRLHLGRALAQAAATLAAETSIDLSRATVAGFVGVATEPPTLPLLEALIGCGARVILPVLQPDRRLEWATGPAELVAGPLGLLEPTGQHLGADGVLKAALVLVPALAVDRSGHRLGRGGGYYDRVLATLPATVALVAVVFDGELLDHVPVEAHDRPVHGVLTPSALVMFD